MDERTALAVQAVFKMYAGSESGRYRWVFERRTPAEILRRTGKELLVEGIMVGFSKPLGSVPWWLCPSLEPYLRDRIGCWDEACRECYSTLRVAMTQQERFGNPERGLLDEVMNVFWAEWFPIVLQRLQGRDVNADPGLDIGFSGITLSEVAEIRILSVSPLPVALLALGYVLARNAKHDCLATIDEVDASLVDPILDVSLSPDRFFTLAFKNGVRTVSDNR